MHASAAAAATRFAHSRYVALKRGKVVERVCKVEELTGCCCSCGAGCFHLRA